MTSKETHVKAQSIARFGSLAMIGALALSACGSDNATQSTSGGSSAATSNVSGTLSGVGASSQSAAMDEWISGFSSVASDAKAQYSPDGSGAGRKAILSGSAQFAGSDSHLKTEEYESSKDVCGTDGAIDIPVYISPIAVAFNLPGVDSLNLDAATIAKIFKGEITKWNDPAIASLNEGVSLPDKAITVVHRSDDSGTTENFTEYLNKASNGAWDKEADGEWPADYSGEAAKGTSGVVKTTTETEGAITYADDSAVGSLGTAKLKVGDNFVEVSSDAAVKTLEASEKVSGMNANDMSYDINRTPSDSSAYPLILVSYHIVCSTYKDQATVDLVKAWESYVISADGQDAAAASAKSAPLSDAIRTDAQKAIDSITVAK